jgi:predicted patatin/cPLA2 family phospholipase
MDDYEGPIDFTLLSVEEKAKLRKQAKERVLADQIKAAQKAYFAKMVEEELRALDPEQEEVEFAIDLPMFAKCVMLNGVQYMHGGVYTTSRARFDSIADIVAQAWRHDDAILEEEIRDRARRSYGTRIRNGAITNMPSIQRGAVRI